MMDDSSFAIDTLNLRLPEGYDHRAEFIAREVGQALSRLPVQHDVQLPAVNVPAVQVHGGESDRVIAQRIAQAIHRQVVGSNTAPQFHAADAGIGQTKKRATTR